jgi:hypothetical protein
MQKKEEVLSAKQAAISRGHQTAHFSVFECRLTLDTFQEASTNIPPTLIYSRYFSR